MRVKNLCLKDYIVKGVKLKFSKNCWGEGISVGVWGITSLKEIQYVKIRSIGQIKC